MLSSEETDIIVESTTHGRERRIQRDISKKDLKAAVKYGIKESGFKCPKTGMNRWKYTYADIVYITDWSSTQEVTSWAVEIPIEKELISGSYQARYEETKRRIRSNPELITSHIVIVVDMSKSMGKSDMNGHLTRSRCVYFELAEELIAANLPPVNSNVFGGHHLNFTDVITLIEMRYEPTIVFESEPISWALYNIFVDLAERKDVREHGNYLPALCVALESTLNYYNSSSTQSIFFFSDGKPSDLSSGFSTLKYFPDNLYNLIEDFCSRFGKHLFFNCFGYGTDESEFFIMKEMVRSAEKAGATASFRMSFGDSNALRTSLIETRSSLISSRTLLSRIRDPKGLKKRLVNVIMGTNQSVFEFSSANWDFFNRNYINATSYTEVTRLGYLWKKKYLYEVFYLAEEKRNFIHPEATGIAVSKKIFDHGAERVVWYMTEIDRNFKEVGEKYVAKGNRHEIDIRSEDSLKDWHRKFIKVQMKAANFAQKFNQRLDSLLVSKTIPRIKFLEPFIYNVLGPNSNSVYLCEKRLNNKNYCKWNDNTGKIDGNNRMNQAFRNDLIFNKQPQTIILEENSDEEDEEDDYKEENIEICCSGKFQSYIVKDLESRILEVDIPQAFSHFTHVYTQRSLIVCDLQGELALIDGDPYFLLTDPAIHSDESKKYKNYYGKTDLGKSGIKCFFETHTCNAVCELLRIKDR